MRVPNHVAIIMDGNGRWARRKGLPRVIGHKKGAEVVENVVRWSAEFGIKYLTLYTFSTENWKRPKEEVEYLFSLLIEKLEAKTSELIKENVRLRFMGRLEDLPEKLKNKCRETEEATKVERWINLIIALNYGGRAEIVDAVRKILKEGATEVNEESFRKYLYLPDVPDPDLIIRTSGEMRLSNFLLWQSAYSELYFTEKLWPDFTKDDFTKALEDYSKRERRFGGVT